MDSTNKTLSHTEGEQKEAVKNLQSGKENQLVEAPSGEQLEQQDEQFCFECQKPLAKSRHIINISGQIHRWHSECFRCEVCKQSLERESSCHVLKDRILCRDDYARLSSQQRNHNQVIKCARCTWPINTSDWVRRAASYVYHLACFSCDMCLRLLSTGEQFTVHVQADSAVKLLCRLHFSIEQPASTIHSPLHLSHAQSHPASLPHLQHTSHPLSTAPQHSPVSGECSSRRANNTIDELTPGIPVQSTSTLESFASKQLHHHHHHQRQHNNRRASSSPSNAQNYDSCLYLRNDDQQHPQSAVSIAKTTLNSSTIQCQQQQQQQQHYMQCFLRNESSGSSTSLQSPQVTHLCRNNKQTTGLLQIVTPSTDETNQRTSTASSASSSSSSTTSGHLLTPTGAPNSKSKRVRTTFTEDQLSILQTHFQIDSNPDGQDLERIATITGLSKRVTQVWFQNSRARQKKYMIKRKPTIGSTTHHLTLSTNLQQYNNPTETAHSTSAGNERSNHQQTSSTWPSQLSNHSEDEDDLSLDAAASANEFELRNSQQSTPEAHFQNSDNSSQS